MKGKVSCEDCFTITGRGTVITGQLKDGLIEKGNYLKIGDNYYKVNGIEMFRKLYDRVNMIGDNIGILIKDLTKEEGNKYRTQIIDVFDLSDIRDNKLKQLGI